MTERKETQVEGRVGAWPAKPNVYRALEIPQGLGGGFNTAAAGKTKLHSVLGQVSGLE